MPIEHSTHPSIRPAARRRRSRPPTSSRSGAVVSIAAVLAAAAFGFAAGRGTSSPTRRPAPSNASRPSRPDPLREIGLDDPDLVARRRAALETLRATIERRDGRDPRAAAEWLRPETIDLAFEQLMIEIAAGRVDPIELSIPAWVARDDVSDSFYALCDAVGALRIEGSGADARVRCTCPDWIERAATDADDVGLTRPARIARALMRCLPSPRWPPPGDPDVPARE